jgi:hypothetical protein
MDDTSEEVAKAVAAISRIDIDPVPHQFQSPCQRRLDSLRYPI